MQAIAKDVYIEDQYPGVTLGAIRLPHGLIQIDAPPSPEDGRAWRAALLNLGGSGDRILINLDAHPDRTVGARLMDCTVIAHERTAHVFRSRPTPFKVQSEETGAEWERIPALGNVRWAPPEISFSHQMEIHWDDAPVLLEHHPGPAAGAIWVILREARVVFVGDAVVRGQPPFLAGADLPAWLEALKVLLSAEYRGWLVVGGRGGLAPAEAIRAQRDYLEQIRHKLEKLAEKNAPPEAIESLLPALLNGFKGSASQQAQFAQRLRYGLRQYYLRHYHPFSGSGGEE
jgi:glyoxylase-like metal-dependent hydrolase (beta-lactamase superfamily II)